MSYQENDSLRKELEEMRERKEFYKSETARLRSDRNYWYDETKRISSNSKCIEDQLKRNNSLLHQEIRELKNTISDLKNNTKDDLEREEGELDDSDNDEKDIQASICGLNKDNIGRGRSKGIVIKVQKEDRYPDPTIISQSHIYCPTMGLLHANNRKNEFMEVKNSINSYKAVDWHGVRMSQIQTSSNADFEATIDFHHCQIQQKEGEYFVMHETLNKVTMGKRFYDRLDSENWMRKVDSPPGRQKTRIRAKVNLVENYLEAFKENRKASIFRIKELVTVVDCHSGSLLPVVELTTFRN
ncbi:hypothetical protein CAEBREN_08508 [Caenorhabditis brenneri]|uniref:Uncharacterized protein n=1 Tax=Caenorhabditis brenneri TaxID=135651 RepID=G0MH00_CAEBE|nr:hypothetical protein CAEBREN_08508 [Caenorhabditis brenneri]